MHQPTNSNSFSRAKEDYLSTEPTDKQRPSLLERIELLTGQKASSTSFSSEETVFVPQVEQPRTEQVNDGNRLNRNHHRSIHQIPRVGEPHRPLASTPRDVPNAKRFSPPMAPTLDLPDPPGEWLPDTNQGEPRKEPQQYDGPYSPAFHDLCNVVMQQYAIDDPTVLLISQVDRNCCCETVAFQLAKHLSCSDVGNVLLVDSHLEHRKLTESFGLGHAPGFADHFQLGTSINDSLFKTEVPQMDFFPVGSQPVCRLGLTQNLDLHPLVKQLRQAYQFIIVCVGDAFDRAVELWSRHCDATYLAVELKGSNRTEARSSVVRLHQFGARLSGCVVTDAA